MIVSIAMITYNHEKYIRQAIEGILLQKTLFQIELIIGEDCSNDKTSEICEEYQSKYPEIIKLKLNDENIGIMPNFISVLQSCTGKYLALCEGDDYWTDPYKLQKQVDFLEANPDYSICFHRVNELKENNFNLSNLNSSNDEQTYTIYNLAKENFIHTPSVMYRWNSKLLPDWLMKIEVGDYPLHMLIASTGLIKYFPEPMAVYRVGVGVWGKEDKILKCNKYGAVIDNLIQEFHQDKLLVKNLITQKNNNFNGALYFREQEILNSYNLLKNKIKLSMILKIIVYKLWFFRK